jgi:catechol 2,3-dioxygenase-like lactoylglutathione lyase family enzyme
MGQLNAANKQRTRTRGLNHVNLLVADVDRSRDFYESALGFEYVRTDSGITFLSTPGVGDLLALQPAGGDLDRLSGKQRSPGDMGGIDHVGFAVDPDTVDQLIEAVENAGGSLLMQLGEGDERTVFVTDPDGYVLQLG